MGREKGLLLIGEISKITGASLRSLRYYEKLGVLTPAHISADTGYRYYSFDQIRLVEMIIFAIELDIPLKELTKFANTDDTVNFRTFLEHGKNIVRQKQKTLRKGLKLISAVEKQMDFADAHQEGQIYEREIQEMFIYAKPCGDSPKGLELLNLLDSFSDMLFSEDDYYELTEIGFICKHTPSGSSYHAFIELPKRLVKKHTKKIPAGTYACIQSSGSQIEQSRKIFKEHLDGKDSFLAIETEVFTGKYNINKPLHELKVIVL
jgi:DNA-binding transcriptional MerR regulator